MTNRIGWLVFPGEWIMLRNGQDVGSIVEKRGKFYASNGKDQVVCKSHHEAVMMLEGMTS